MQEKLKGKTHTKKLKHKKTGNHRYKRKIIKEKLLPLLDGQQYHYGSTVALYIAKNPVYHKRTKYIEVDCHFIWEKVTKKETQLEYSYIDDKITDFFTKVVAKRQLNDVLFKLGKANKNV